MSDLSPNAKACANCAHYLVDKESRAAALNLKQPEVGQCRRFPPTAVLVPAQGGAAIMAAFPPVQRDLFCGEFRVRLQPLTPPATVPV